MCSEHNFTPASGEYLDHDGYFKVTLYCQRCGEIKTITTKQAFAPRKETK